MSAAAGRSAGNRELCTVTVLVIPNHVAVHLGSQCMQLAPCMAWHADFVCDKAVSTMFAPCLAEFVLWTFEQWHTDQGMLDLLPQHACP